MTLSVACNCGAKLKVKQSLVGKPINCPKCGESLTVEPPSARFVPVVDEDVPETQHKDTPFDSDEPHSRLPLILSGAALGLSALSLLIVLFGNPLARGMAAYDFSTPVAAIKSSLLIDANGDFMAKADIERIHNAFKRRKAEALSISQTIDHGGMRFCFCEHDMGSGLSRDVFVVQKNVDTGLWFLMDYDLAYLLADDPDLRSQIHEWNVTN